VFPSLGPTYPPASTHLSGELLAAAASARSPTCLSFVVCRLWASWAVRSCAPSSYFSGELLVAAASMRAVPPSRPRQATWLPLPLVGASNHQQLRHPSHLLCSSTSIPATYHPSHLFPFLHLSRLQAALSIRVLARCKQRKQHPCNELCTTVVILCFNLDFKILIFSFN
jgi:hypothetical protein